MDPEVELVLKHYRHLFPDFSVPHAVVYKLLWRVHPMQTEEIVKQSSLSNATVYRILHDLLTYDLIDRTNFKPVGYYAANPVKDFNSHIKKVLIQLEKGADELDALLKNSSSLSGELYLVEKDGGQQKLIVKETRENLNEIEQLLLIKKTAEAMIKGKAIKIERGNYKI